ncbi:MAG TPA: DinB family protein [Thermoanaerobaculia bacterium]|nr:DinB family protein [Thermoanaerobaculia bacterium]
MKVHEFFVKRWEQEQPAFAKVMKAIPADKLDYRPHERSNSAGGIAWQLVEEQRAQIALMEQGQVEWQTKPQPASLDEIVQAWEQATEELRKQLSTLDDAKSASDAKMLAGGTPVWSDTMENMLWGFLLDMIHHRGQLSSYLRPMGGKVPAIYGPSADDTGAT